MGDLLARVLEIVSAGSAEVFAPRTSCPARLVKEPSRGWRGCAKRLLETGCCLHGRAVAGSLRRRQPTMLHCWYCTVTLPQTPEGAEELEKHGDTEHSSQIQAWIRKARKVKARRQRDWYEA